MQISSYRPSISITCVTDIIFAEIKEEHSHLLPLGLKVITLTADSVQNLESLVQNHPKPSFNDLSALALATQEDCVLLTGDKNLRDAAMKEDVVVHGTIWIVEQMLIMKIIDFNQAKNSFEEMKSKGRWLPWHECEKVLIKYQELKELEITPSDFQIVDVTLPLGR